MTNKRNHVAKGLTDDFIKRYESGEICRLEFVSRVSYRNDMPAKFSLSCAGALPRSKWNGAARNELLLRSWNFFWKCCRKLEFSLLYWTLLYHSINTKNQTYTYLFTAWSRVLLEKLTVSHLVKKFPSFYGIRRFITATKTARHLSLSWARSIQSMPSYPTSWRPILIFTPFPFPQVPHQTPLHISTLPHTCYMPWPHHSSRFHYPEKYWMRSRDH